MVSYMSADLLLNTSNLKILISNNEVGPHLLKSLVRDSINSKLLLTLGQAEP